MTTDLAALLWRRRNQLGLSQAGAGRLLGVPVGTIADWEAGRRGRLKPITLALACEILRLRIEGCEATKV